MANIKEMAFLLLILLVSVSALYEWAQTDDVLKKDLGMGSVAGFEVATLENYLSDFEFEVSVAIEAALRIDVVSFLLSLVNVFLTTFTIFMKLMFGWVELVGAIFTAVGLSGLDIVFTGPLAIIQIFALFYFLRDLVNTVRGVGTG